jgi:hypothetical protein
MNILWAVLIPLVDEPPAPEDVKAGWVAFAIFLLLGAAVVFLGFSLRKQLRKVDFEEEGSTPDPNTEARPASDDGR